MTDIRVFDELGIEVLQFASTLEKRYQLIKATNTFYHLQEDEFCVKNLKIVFCKKHDTYFLIEENKNIVLHPQQTCLVFSFDYGLFWIGGHSQSTFNNMNLILGCSNPVYLDIGIWTIQHQIEFKNRLSDLILFKPKNYGRF